MFRDFRVEHEHGCGHEHNVSTRAEDGYRDGYGWRTTPLTPVYSTSEMFEIKKEGSSVEIPAGYAAAATGSRGVTIQGASAASLASVHWWTLAAGAGAVAFWL